MIPSLIILAALVFVGLILYIHHRLTDRDNGTEPKPGDNVAAEGTPRPEGCCGMHAVCEKANEAALNEQYYYDDEELDVFTDRDATSYSDAETDAFRDVLYTLRRDEIAAWAQALEHRRIAMPEAVRDEVMLLLRDGV